MANYNLTQTGAEVQVILDTVAAGYIYMGVADLTTTPDTTNPNVCYLLKAVGTYTNFGNIQHANGIGIALWNGSAWSYQNVPYITDATPMANSTTPVQSGGVFPIKEKTDFFTIERISGDNLIDPSTYINGKYVNSSGGESTNANWSCTPYIPVQPNQYMTFYGINNSGSSTGMRYVNWFDENKNQIGSQEGSVVHSTSPATAAYVRCSTYNAYQDYVQLKKTGMFYGSHANEQYYSIPYLTYDTNVSFSDANDKSIVIKGDILNIISSKRMSVAKSGDTINLIDPSGNTLRFDVTARGNSVSNYWVANIGGREMVMSDDVAPVHILRTTIGSNHGFVAYAATIASHGLTNTSIGTAWTKGGNTFYIVKIIDSNTIAFYPANNGTRSNPDRPALTAGTLTNGGTTKNASAVTSYNLYPSVKNREYSVIIDGNVVDEDYSGNAEEILISEKYDIISPDDMLTNLIARVGQSDEPVYDGNAIAQIRNSYRINWNLSSIVTQTLTAYEQLRFADIMFAQHGVNEASAASYLVPNSLPIGTYDFRTPISVTWGSASLPEMNFTSEYWADQTKPVNRAIEMKDGNGMAIGFVPFGIGANLLQYTSQPIRINKGTGKIYPHGVDSVVKGETLQVGDSYTASMFRSFFSENTSGRYASYWYRYNGATYVYVEYSASVSDVVVVSDELNGCEVSVIESKNATLQSDIYNGGINVKSTYVSGDSCFIVLKIK